MKRRRQIVIAGGGVVGLAMAALLSKLSRQAGLQITLVDSANPQPFDAAADIGLRVSALAAGSIELLAGLGVREALLDRSCPYRDMRVWDAGGTALGSDALHFAAADVALPELGFIVEDALLRHLLLETLQSIDVTTKFGAGISTVDSAHYPLEITLSDGTELQADLLIAADGARSAVRETAGIDVDGWDYNQAALVTHAQPERPHQHTAWQRFLADGPIALLPLSDGRVSIVWSTSPDQVKALIAADDDVLSARLTEASDAAIGSLTLAGPRASFPLRAQHAKHYVQRGLALIGDAAHTVHPLAGQGANLGLADAAALARVVGAALAADEYPGDLPVLRRYERERRGANATMLRFIDGLNRLFASGTGLGEVRQAGMRAFNRSNVLKRQVMEVALGL